MAVCGDQIDVGLVRANPTMGDRPMSTPPKMVSDNLLGPAPRLMNIGTRWEA